MTVVSGEALLAAEGTMTEVTTSNRAVLNWESFSIQQHETIRFIQPSIDSAVLNRVTGGEMSQLLGLLQSNGQVYLVNPHGVVIGKEGRIDTAAFIASALEIRPEEFVQGQDLHLLGDSVGSVINLGMIQAAGGPVALIAHRVENQGSIEGAIVSLASGHELLLQPSGNTLLFIRPDLKSAGVANSGSISALQAQLQTDGAIQFAINLGDVSQANSLVHEGGRVYLRAVDAPIDISGQIVAHDGDIAIEGAELITFSGHLDVSGETGGKIYLYSEEIRLTDGQLDASGQRGAGEILIGQKESGNAQLIEVAPGVELRADSYLSGDGGRMLLLADGRIDFQGHISAQAFGSSGNGGNVEISARKSLSCPGFSDLRSKEGNFGHFLFDPPNITISTAATGGDNYNDTDLGTQLGLGNVTLTSGAAGVITFVNSAVLTISWSAATTFALNGSSIVTSGASAVNITNSSASTTPFTAVDFRANTGGAPTGTGTFVGINLSNVVINTSSSMGAGAVSMQGLGGDTGSGCTGIYLPSGSITTYTGAIALTGYGGGNGAFGSLNYGLRLVSETCTTYSGAITLVGTSQADTTAGDTNSGVVLQSGTSLVSTATSGAGTISVTGQGALNGDSFNIGVNWAASLTSSNAPIQITGYTGGVGTGNYGVTLGSGSITGTNGASLTITGTGPTTLAGGLGTSSSSVSGHGVYCYGINVTLSSGNIVLAGYGKGTGGDAAGIYFEDLAPATVWNTGSGAITMTGVGSANGTAMFNSGIAINYRPLISTTSGSITLTGTSGTGAGGFNNGIYWQSTKTGAMSSNIFSVSGNIQLTGTSLSGEPAVFIENGNGPYTTGSGNISISATGGDLQLGSSGSSSTTLISTYGSGNITLSTTNSNILIGDTGGQAVTVASSGTGNVSVASAQNLTVAKASITSASTGTITLQASTDIVLGNTVTIQGTDGNILLLGGANITATGSQTIQTTGLSSTITLVADNAYGPLTIGPGLFTLVNTTTLTSSKVNLFAGNPGTSTFPATINGLAYTAGTGSGASYVPGTNELVGTYWYPTLLPPAISIFQISYKKIPPPTAPPAVVVVVATIATTQSTVVPTQVSPQTLTTMMTIGAANQDPQATCGAPSVSIGM
jgi:filamentous hemagglutinin family protein